MSGIVNAGELCKQCRDLMDRIEDRGKGAGFPANGKAYKIVHLWVEDLAIPTAKSIPYLLDFLRQLEKRLKET